MTAASIEDAFGRAKETQGGSCSQDLARLSEADPKAFALCVYHRVGNGGDWIKTEHGNCADEATAQSVSKIVNEAIARTMYSPTYESLIGSSASDAGYDDVVTDAEHRPLNAMGNFGAIGTCILIQDNASRNGIDAAQIVLDHWSNIFATSDKPPKVEIDEEVYEQDRACIEGRMYDAHLHAYDGATADGRSLRNVWAEHNISPSEKTIRDGLDLFVKCCAIRVNPRTLASLSLLLLNRGVNSFTHRRIFSEEICDALETSLLNGGLYSESQTFAQTTGGVPCKSGISGALTAYRRSKHMHFAFGSYGPRLNSSGNSVAGLAALQIIARSVE